MVDAFANDILLFLFYSSSARIKDTFEKRAGYENGELRRGGSRSSSASPVPACTPLLATHPNALHCLLPANVSFKRLLELFLIFFLIAQNKRGNRNARYCLFTVQPWGGIYCCLFMAIFSSGQKIPLRKNKRKRV